MKQHIKDKKTEFVRPARPSNCRTGGCYRTSQSRKPDGVGSAHEFNPQPRNGNRKSRIDLCLNEMLPGMSRRYVGQ